MTYTLVPISLDKAKKFVDSYHRHNVSPQGWKFGIGLECEGELIGVVCVGRPVARALDDGYTAEVTRSCVIDNMPNANSMLYGAARRACKAMGYTKLITYTQHQESGSSLKAIGMIPVANLKPRGDWADSGVTRVRTKPKKVTANVERIRWEIQL
jgi:hypothetical protein